MEGSRGANTDEWNEYYKHTNREDRFLRDHSANLDLIQSQQRSHGSGISSYNITRCLKQRRKTDEKSV